MSDLGSYMDSIGEQLVSAGYPIIPIEPGTKRPAVYKFGAWTEYYDWQKHCTRDTKPFETDVWRRWPGCAVGIACGRVVGIDIDVLDNDVAHAVEMLARERLGDTPAKRIGLAPKRMLVYRCDVPFRSFDRSPLQVIALGRQFVGYAIHPDTGRPYQWPNHGLDTLNLASLPLVDEAGVLAFMNEAFELVPVSMRKATLAVADTRDHGVHGEQRGTYEAVAAALACIPNNDVDRESWVRMGQAIRGALGEDGRDLWLAWSRSSGKSGKSRRSDTAERKWKGFRAGSIGAGTIYALARDNGWRPAGDLVLSAARAEALATGEHSGDALFDALLAEPVGGQDQAEEVTPMPYVVGHGPLPVAAELFDVGGALGDLVELAVRSAPRPQPFLALASAIAAVGALAGRRYESPTRLRTNVYIGAICESGGGKDHPPEIIRRAFDRAGLDRYLGGEAIASGAGMLAALAAHPAKLFQVDEFGLFLSGATGAKAAQHRADIWTELLKLYSRAKGTYRGAEYANQKLNKRVDLVQPHVCFAGSSTPSTFWTALAGGAMLDGSLARFLIVVTPDERPKHNREPDTDEPSPELIARLQAIAAGAVGHDYGDLSEPMLSNVEVDAYTVRLDDAAESVLTELYEAEDVWANAVRGTPKAAIVARLAENSIKLAMVRAISRRPESPLIEGSDMMWGWRFAEHCIRSLLREADRHISDNEADRNHKKTLELIRAAAPAGLTRSQLMNRTHFLGERREAVFSALIESGTVKREIVMGKTKSTTWYRPVAIA